MKDDYFMGFCMADFLNQFHSDVLQDDSLFLLTLATLKKNNVAVLYVENKNSRHEYYKMFKSIPDVRIFLNEDEQEIILINDDIKRIA